MKEQEASPQEIVAKAFRFIKSARCQGKSDVEMLKWALAIVGVITKDKHELEAIALPTLRALMRRMSN
jgi:hypothetical protein